MPVQTELWHETLEDALRSTVDALGGPKRVASALWPAKSITEAARFLNHCLDAERPEKLHLQELVWLMREGRRAGCHLAMAFLAEACDYEAPVPRDPQVVIDRLRQEYVAAVQELRALTERMERLEGGCDGVA